MSDPKVVTCDEFLEWFKKREDYSHHEPLIVQGDVHIKPVVLNEKVKTLDFERITFTGSFTIEDFSSRTKEAIRGLSVRNCNLLHGLYIRDCKFGHISIHNIERAGGIDMWRCDCETMRLKDIATQRSIDLSGVTASEWVSIENVNAEGGIELFNERTTDTVKTPLVWTDSKVVARQFELAQIPVFASHKSVIAWLTPPPAEEIRLA